MDIIPTVDLFPRLDAKLIEVLRTLTPEDWQKPTLASAWCVKDVAVHLLDGNLRTLSMLRDGYFGSAAPEINSYRDLVEYLNRLNAEWVLAMKRLSPAIIIELLEQTGNQYSTFLKTLDPTDKAAFAVAWAGEEESQNWFHIARDYTEKWHHQQQIRAAVGQEQELYVGELFYPYLETSMRALPYHYRNVKAPAGTVIKFVVRAATDYIWFLHSDGGTWELRKETNLAPAGEIILSQEISWRIFSKAVTPEEARKQITSSGNTQLAEKIVDMVAVMA
ncbi:maleylpyruvate isomerase N-terminal domain-containing protein [Salmonirosea aquatica]